MSYREQFIWQKGVDLSVKCYEVTRAFPPSEIYGLTSQIKRSAVSIPSNIAEGYGRQTTSEYIQYLHIALGSLRELDTQLTIAHRVQLTNNAALLALLSEVEEMQKLLVTTLKTLKSRRSTALKGRGQGAEGRGKQPF